MLPDWHLTFTHLPLLLAVLCIDFVHPILLLGLRIPPFVKQGESVKLVCEYDLEYDGLYSLKWYKDGQEFYSYIPRLVKDPKRFFDLPGVFLDKAQSDDRQVVLHNVTVAGTEGEYKCQVSGEGPLFATEIQTKKLRVAVVPTKRPLVKKVPAHFSPGDWLHLNCTAGPARPPIRLTWFVNGREADDIMIRRFGQSPSFADTKMETSVMDRIGLSTSELGLQFWVKADHFDQGKLRVKCRGEINSVYQMESDTFVVGQLDMTHDKVLHAKSSAARHISGTPLKKCKSYFLLLNILGVSSIMKLTMVSCIPTLYS